MLAMLISMVVHLCAKAQQPAFHHFTVEDGLPSAYAYFVAQDADGFIWITTETGASRYNGHTFQNFYTDDGLTDNENFRAHLDSEGRLWFLPYNGKTCYRKDGVFYSAANDSMLATISAKSFQQAFCEDDEGGIWLGTFRTELLHFPKNGIPTKRSLRQNGRDSIGRSSVLWLENGDVWVGGSFG